MVRFWIDLAADGRANIKQVDANTGVTLMHYCAIVNDVDALRVLLQSKLTIGTQPNSIRKHNYLILPRYECV